MGGVLLVLAAIAGLGVASHPAPKRTTPKPQPKSRVVAELESADSIPASPASWAPGFPMLPDGRFPVATYAGPTATQTTDFRYLEMQQAGINIVLKMLNDPGLPESNRQRIEVGARHNTWSFVLDTLTSAPDRAYLPGWKAGVDTLAAFYWPQKGMLGHFLAEDPSPKNFASLGAINQRLAKKDPGHPGLVIFPDLSAPASRRGGMPYTTYLRRDIELARPAIIAVRSYPLRKTADLATFVTTWDSVATVSSQMATPFWAVLNVSPFGSLRVPNASELAWQVNLPIAYGARGIVWFTYWTPPATDPAHYHDGPLTYDGRRTATYGRLTDVNAHVQALTQEIGTMRWQGVRHVGTVPLGCRGFRATPSLRIESPIPVTIGFFKQMSGANFGLIVNRDYKSVANVKIFAPDTLLRWARAPGLYRTLEAKPIGESIQNALLVAPGDAELIRLPRSFDYLTTQ